MKLYLMRHGQTNYNLLGLCNDDPHSDVHLTDLGCQQARTAAEQLRNTRLEHIFVSELPRTRQTAEIVRQGRAVPVTARAELNDIRSGFNNLAVAEYFAATGHDRLRRRVNGGESLLDYKARVLPFLDWLRQRPEQVVLVVAHEETLRVIATHLRGLSDEEMERLAFGNGEIIELELSRATTTNPQGRR
jgi:probable phosphoglycerate mutase